MRIGPFNISRQQDFAEAPVKKVNTSELGGSGTTVYDGMISNVEYNPKLNPEYGMGGLDVYDQMRKSDPIVKQSLLIVTMPIMQATWTIDEPDDESQAEEITDFVRQALFERMERSWPDVVREILTYLPMGFSVFEKVFMIEDNQVWLKKLAMRTQKSVMKFATSNGDFGITQQLSSPDWKQVSIPREKLLLFTNDREGDNYRGVSVLRSAYKPYYFKELLEKIDAISFERHGVGVPVFRAPKSPKPSDMAKAEELGKNLRANEKAFVILPFEWELEILKGQQASDATEKIKRYNREILSNVLAQFLDLGATSSGSRSLSEDHSDLFFKIEQSHGDYICDIMNDHLIPQLVDLNFNNVKQYPKMSVSNIQKINMQIFSQALNQLAQAKMITIDVEFEEYIRDIFGLPSMSEELKNQKEEELKAITEFKKNNPMGNVNNDENNDNSNVNKDPKKVDKRDNNVNENAKPPLKQASETLKYEQAFTECHDCSLKFAEESFFRELTFAEQKIDFDTLRRTLNELEMNFSDELREIIESELSMLLARVRVALRMNDVVRLEELFSQFRFEVEQILRDQMNRSVELGKRTASKTLQVPIVSTSKERLDIMNARISSVAQKITQDLNAQVKLNALEHLQLGTDAVDAVKAIRTNAEKLVNRQVQATSSSMLMGGFNQGRDIVFEEHSEKIYALQRSEILDNRICNYCLSVDARVVTPKDPIAKQDQFHFGCRGIWVEVLIDEENKPEITGIPDDLRNRVGSLTDFKQIAKPQPLQNSLAEEYVIANKR